MVLAACSVSLDKLSVTSFLEKRKDYTGKLLTVAGYLLQNSEGIFLTDRPTNNISDDINSITLAIPKEIYGDIGNYQYQKVYVLGQFHEHGFEEHDGELLFFPSRFVVSHITLGSFKDSIPNY